MILPRSFGSGAEFSNGKAVGGEGIALIRVLHVLDSLQLGGTEWQCLSLARNLDPIRYQNVFVCFNRGGPLVETLRRTGVPSEVIPFPGFRRLAGVKGLVRLSTFMRRNRIHVVQAYGFYSNVPAILAGRMAGVPILIASRRDMGEFLTRHQRLAERGVFRLADRVVVNADAIKAELLIARQVREEKIVVIPTGVDLDRFDQDFWDESGNCQPPWAMKGKVVAMVANFRGQKDQTTLLHAAKRILTIDPTVVFVLAGGVFQGSAICESLRQSAEQIAEEIGISSSVWFLGAVDPGTIPGLLQHVDVSVLASRGNEGIPNAILEAMAAGKPVVATDTGGCREVVQHGVTGFLVPPGDPAQLADRILRLLRNDRDAARMGKAGRKRAEAQFSLSPMIHRFSSLYSSLAREKLGHAAEVR